MTRRGVIFDMDGVLIDSYHAHFQSWLQVAGDYGLEPFTEETFSKTFGRTSRDIIQMLWGDRVAEARVAEIDDRKEAHYRERIAKEFPAMDGADDLIAALHKAGFAIAIGSSGPPANVRAAMNGLRSSGAISATVTGNEVTRGKPDPEVFLKAAGKLKLSPQACAVIEDAPAGVEAAVRAGMTAIAITGTVEREKLSHAHLIVDSLRDLTPPKIADLIDRR